MVNKKRFDFGNRTLKSTENYNPNEVIKRVEQEVGKPITISFKPDGTIVMDTDKLPEGVTESEVETALDNALPSINTISKPNVEL